jgi:hypothetical protein
MAQPMKHLAWNAISYCKPAINAGLFSVIESSTPILLSGYGYSAFETQSGSSLKFLIVDWSETF